MGLPVFEVFSSAPRQVINNVAYTFGRIVVATGLINFERMAVRSVKVQVRKALVAGQQSLFLFFFFCSRFMGSWHSLYITRGVVLVWLVVRAVH